MEEWGPYPYPTGDMKNAEMMHGNMFNRFYQLPSLVFALISPLVLPTLFSCVSQGCVLKCYWESFVVVCSYSNSFKFIAKHNIYKQFFGG